MTDQCNCDQSIRLRAELDSERRRYRDACGERDRLKCCANCCEYEYVEHSGYIGCSRDGCEIYPHMVCENWGSK